MHYLIYLSQATRPLSAKALACLLEQARQVGTLIKPGNQWSEDQIRERASRIVAFAEAYWLGTSKV